MASKTKSKNLKLMKKFYNNFELLIFTKLMRKYLILIEKLLLNHIFSLYKIEYFKSFLVLKYNFI
ncbi:MAG: hypothetical protein CMF98_03895 [Candidatus Marinimicrobia bacterium]|nr:hypothetical protein [Candidatus Neomarinimicrobiota bacterium]OUW50617.1 MAG: hypothetical protein CBD50_02490 [bacterium TMED190]